LQASQLNWYKESNKQHDEELAAFRGALNWHLIQTQGHYSKLEERLGKIDEKISDIDTNVTYCNSKVQEINSVGNQRYKVQRKDFAQYKDRFEAQTRKILENQTGTSHRAGRRYHPY
jgi:predicted  nucleic acid-binding Zn-ribbon protein